MSLTANPGSGYSFSGWSGNASGTANPVSVTMDGNKAVTATFTQNIQYTLAVNVVGTGSVTKSPNKATYNQGEQVSLMATVGAGFGFSGWSGDASGMTNPVSVTMDGNKAVTATFTQNQSTQYTLTVSVVGTGSVTKSPNKATYDQGELVSLTANPGSGYSFSGWSGNASGTANPVSVTIHGWKQGGHGYLHSEPATFAHRSGYDGLDGKMD